MSKRLSIAGLFLFLLLARADAAPDHSGTATASDYLIHVWQTDNGLPQNWVSSIAQTPDGYLWIGTRYGGLARFDGVRFVSFNQQNTAALKDVQVEHLSVDSTGRLWIIMGNESITALENQQFELFRWPRDEPHLRADHVLEVKSNRLLFAGEMPYLATLDIQQGTNGWSVQDPRDVMEPDPGTFSKGSDGTIWFVTREHQLGRFQHGSFEKLTPLPGTRETSVTAIALDSQSRLWAATPRRLLRWSGEKFEDKTPPQGPPPGEIIQISFSGDGGAWVLEKNQLRKLVNGQWAVQAQPPGFRAESAPASFILHGDASGNAWLIDRGHGMWHIKSDGSASLLTEKTGLPSVFIDCWFQDAEGDVWIGTAGGGIARIRESLFHALGSQDGLPGKVVRSVCVDNKNELWAGTMSGGLAHWKNGRFASFPLPTVGSNPTESVTVFPEREGGLWIGTLNQGLMRVHNGAITRPTIPWGTIRVLLGDSQGQLWVGGLVNLFRLKDDQTTVFGSADGFVDSHAIGSLAEAADGSIWIGTGPGELWNYSNGNFTRHSPPKEWPSVRFAAVLPDSNGVVWVGTLGGGLLRFHDGQFTRCTKQNGLPDDNVSQLLDSHDGQLWAGTYAGIFRAAKSDIEAAATGGGSRVQCRVYGLFDGLPSLECSSGFQPSCWRGKDGHLYFSTANGVVTVNPLEITTNQAPPRVIIEEMLVDGRPRNPGGDTRMHVPAGEDESPMEIQPGRHYIQFRFTGLNFAAPDGVRFRVKLDGVDREWQSIGGQRTIGYGPLQPREYKFHVIASNNEGVWSPDGAALSFHVLPYFWETLWFKAALAATALGGLGLVVGMAQQRRYRLKLERVERQREMERERSRIAHDLHDDLGTSLTQISMLTALANRDTTPPTEARDLMRQVRGRAREMVTALDEIVWAVNPRNDSLIELVNYLGHFAEEFFRPANIRCRLDFPAQIPSLPIPSEMRHHLFLAFKEAINNAARHSQAHEVLIRVEIKERELWIHIEDNGIGFAQNGNASHRNGDGLVNIDDRMKQAGGKARVQSVRDKGTSVTLQVELKTASPEAN